MSISDEQLDAYVDGELSDAMRALVDQAISQDAAIARRVVRQQALRQRLGEGFDGVLQEPVPDRLLALVKQAKFDTVAPVADLAAARDRTTRLAAGRLSAKSGWLAIAATILVGSIAGLLAARLHSDEDFTTLSDGKLVAHGTLASALNEQLASAIAPNASVRVGLSFKATNGRYCRTFEFAGAEGAAGLACREQQQWRVLSLIERPAKEGTDPTYRMAGSTIPPLLLQLISENISGEPLDAQAELRARSAGWQ
jgi:anti-sigma-K factor RskA